MVNHAGVLKHFVLHSPTAEQEGRAIVDVVGCGKRVVTAYWRHDLMAKALAVLPRSVMDHAMARTMVKMRHRELEVEREGKQRLVVDTSNLKLADVKSEDERDVMLAVGGDDAEIPTPTATECSDNTRYARFILILWTMRFILTLSSLCFGILDGHSSSTVVSPASTRSPALLIPPATGSWSR
jgi:hypothetical protein